MKSLNVLRTYHGRVLWWMPLLFAAGVWFVHLYYDYDPLPEVIVFAVVAMASLGSANGLGLRRFLVDPRARLIPEFVATHVEAAVGLTVVWGILIVAAGRMLYPGYLSYIGLTGIMAAAFLLCFSIRLFEPPRYVPFVLPVWIFLGAMFLSEAPFAKPTVRWLVSIAVWGSPAVVLRLMLLNMAVAFGLARRVGRIAGNAKRYELFSFSAVARLPMVDFDYLPVWVRRWREGREAQFDAALAETRAPSRRLPLGLLFGGLLLRRTPYLYGAVNTGVWVLLLWVLKRLAEGVEVPWIVGMTLFLSGPLCATTMLHPSMAQWRQSLQSTLLLPMRRRDLLTAVGRAFAYMYASSVLPVVAAILIVEWMTSPVHSKGLPPLWLMLAGLAVHLLWFAHAVLTIRWSEIRRGLWMLPVIAVAGALCGRESREHAAIAFLLIAGVGVALNAYAYRRWIELEVD